MTKVHTIFTHQFVILKHFFSSCIPLFCPSALSSSVFISLFCPALSSSVLYTPFLPLLPFLKCFAQPFSAPPPFPQVFCTTLFVTHSAIFVCVFVHPFFEFFPLPFLCAHVLPVCSDETSSLLFLRYIDKHDDNLVHNSVFQSP